MKPLIVITGPTATGKSKLAVQLAKEIQGEIISADSMQVYKGMDIGTAKVTLEEMDGIKHHLIDVLNPDEGCSIARFQKMVKEALADIYARGKVPILAGGTGFYIQSIIYDVTFMDHVPDNSYRERLEEMAKNGDKALLFSMLEAVDSDSAKTIHMNNTKRVIRALEYYHMTNEPISLHNRREKEKQSPYNLGFYVLNMERELLYKRINDRVDQMVEEGLVEEVKTLLEQGYNKSLVAMQGLGYKEIIGYLEGEYDLNDAIDLLKKGTRHFAKRQLTWFKREKNVNWVNLHDYNYDMIQVVKYILKDIEVQKFL
ncbi:tRNA (adenosine(37)-N6)-dimethylallyltransferase MiaA [Petrocella sp. FN5]|uniref:tRNA (adenosine(37)-N6)-dimethylallyltransferase MiaA n=1 Tax=Petrocella sp. FN5 TaxID=3032002 RepID=UPI0023DC29DE|nr:tRNA (adenosine(37)-N6)-dimethylallyltransferase MiaA [Petrocella sp. FN5]MDF1617542.1 tRNA (adenosine(37)-N6)-dimethylallyltransferase MiaA [Petrocella sp. FN5]